MCLKIASLYPQIQLLQHISDQDVCQDINNKVKIPIFITGIQGDNWAAS